MKCTQCGSENGGNARFCRGCGNTLEKIEPVAIGNFVQCSKCGHANEAGKNFCAKCGESLVGAAPAPVAPVMSHSSVTPGPMNSPAAPLRPANAAIQSLPSADGMNKWVVGGMIAAILLAAAGGGGYWHYQKQKAEKALTRSQVVTPHAIANPTMAVLAMIAAAKRGNNAEILSAKVALDSLPKPGRGDRKSAREKNTLGLDALKINNYESAITHFSEGVAADPSDVEVKNNLGYALMIAGRLDDAKKTLIESLALDSARGAAWANLGQTLAKQGDEDSAVAAFVNTFVFSRAQIKTVEFLAKLSQSDPNQKVKSAAAKALETPLIKATDTSPRPAQTASSNLPNLEARYKQNPAYKSAVLAIFQGAQRTPWIEQYGYGGWGNDGKAATIDGANYEFYNTCKPKDCGDKQFFVLFAPRGRQAWAIIAEDGNIGFYGNPQGAVGEYLKTEARNALARGAGPIPATLSAQASATSPPSGAEPRTTFDRNTAINPDSRVPNLPRRPYVFTNPLNPVGQPPHVGDCRAIAYSTGAKDYEGYVNWCLNWWDAHPNSQCIGTSLPCGNACFSPFLGQSCENNKLIACTPDGRSRLRC